MMNKPADSLAHADCSKPFRPNLGMPSRKLRSSKWLHLIHASRVVSQYMTNPVNDAHIAPGQRCLPDIVQQAGQTRFGSQPGLVTPLVYGYQMPAIMDGELPKHPGHMVVRKDGGGRSWLGAVKEGQ